MSNDILPFQYGGHQVRTVVIDGEPWFVLTDLCAVLGLTTPSRVAERIDPAAVSQTHISSGGQMRQATIVSEPGMYEVVIRSDKAEAVNFRRWITSVVLPSIRKTGSYGAPDLSTPEGVLALAQTLTKTAEELVAAKNAMAMLEPLAAQARTHNLGKGHQTKQDFAREIVTWAVSEGIQVKQPDVIEYMARELDLFVTGDRSDHGVATLSGVRRGLSVTDKGVAKNGYAYATGKLTPKGVDYAWARLRDHITTNRSIIIRKKGVAA